MSGQFYAMLSRMKYIQRWALMRNTYPENISEHSEEVAMLAHALAVIGNKRLGKQLDASKAALIGIFHDSQEIITGDMPTPIKYYNDDTRTAFKNVEEEASNLLLSMLPEDIRAEYLPLFFEAEGDEYLWKLVKAADRLSALIKCMEEEKAGNREFAGARAGVHVRLTEMHLPEADIFMKEFLPAYELTLDDLKVRDE